MLFGVGVSCRVLYSIVCYLYVGCSGSITTVGEEGYVKFKDFYLRTERTKDLVLKGPRAII